MSLMQTIVTTIARFWPDKAKDPLIDHAGFVGTPVQRVDGEAKVKGEARFTAEYKVPHCVYAALVPSTITRGKILKVDVAQAKNVDGVLEVITYENAPRMKAPPITDFNNLGKGVALSDLPIMQDAEIHWDGEPVAVVIAETLEQASYAATLVRVEYRTEAAATSFDGLKSQAVVPADVMGEPAEIKIGNVERGLKNADVTVDHVYRAARYNHNSIEPHATIAEWNEDGSLTVFDSTQSVNLTAHSLAYVFGLKNDKVQVIAPFVGGGFGGKAGLWTNIALCAAAAKVVKRPVKLALSREDTFRVIGGRTISEQRITLAAKKDGKLTALCHAGLTATTKSGRYAEQCTFPSRHLYHADNFFIGQKIVYLDTVANTWMRAPGESIGTFALESALDELAYELRLDPIEVRRINEPDKDPTKGSAFSSRQLVEAYRRGAEQFGWANRDRRGRVHPLLAG